MKNPVEEFEPRGHHQVAASSSTISVAVHAKRYKPAGQQIKDRINGKHRNEEREFSG